jgi:hypothetical protein
MTSPGGRKFDKDRPRESFHFRGKVPVRYIDRFAGISLRRCQSSPASATNTLLSLSFGRDAVFCSALRTTDNNAIIHKGLLVVGNEKPPLHSLTVATDFIPHNIRHIFPISTHYDGIYCKVGFLQTP